MRLETKERLKTPLRTLRYKYWIIKEKIQGVDFTTQVNLDQIGIAPERGNRYQASVPRMKRLFDRFGITDRDVFLDLGCGKGKAMWYVAKYPFGKILGVEWSEELVKVAKNNFRRLGLSRCEVIQGDAGQFHIPEEVTYIYMCNPFPEMVMKEVMERIRESLERKRRKITIVYGNPVCHDVIIDSGLFHEVKDWKNNKVYTSTSAYSA